MNFTCRRCHAPIELDKTFLKLTPTQINLLINKSHNHAHDTSNLAILESLDPRDLIPEDRLKRYKETEDQKPLHTWNLIESDDDTDTESEANSYVVLTDEEQNEVRDTISARVKVLERVFDILSSNQDIPHPLSEGCASIVMDNLKSKFDQRQREKEAYLGFLHKLKEREGLDVIQDEGNAEKLQAHLEKLERLNLERDSKLAELKSLEHQKKELEQELAKYTQDLEAIQNNDLMDLLMLRNKSQLELDSQIYKLEQLKASYKMNLNHLDKLRNMNIYEEVFCISFDDNYSTINGFRLGHKVVWPEINAALGQIVLLLVFLVDHLKINLDHYQLVPVGSQSKIIKFVSSGTTESKQVLNLYTQNEFSLAKLFNFNKLNGALIALLDIVAQIEECLEMDLPYKISQKRDTIGGKSIRFSSNSEWTQSCQFLLTDLKWLLTYAKTL